MAVAALIVGAPLMASALGDDDADSTLTGASVALPTELVERDEASEAFVPAATPKSETPAAAPETPVPDTSAAAGVAAPVPDTPAEPPLDVHLILTDTYQWDERTLKVAALQDILNVSVDGWYSPETRTAHLEFLQYIGLSVDGIPLEPPPGTSADQWAALRRCESGGDYSIVSSSGRYRGAYQFVQSTWDSVASRNDPALVGIDPATATPAQQDAMAFALYREAGAGPWPVCGRNL